MSDERFFDEFADDFYAEATEHLAVLRRGFLNIEDEAREGRLADPRVLGDIARSLHTLKGLTSMVGLVESATTAHEMEEALRGIAAPGEDVAAERLTAFFAAVQVLEDQLSAYRTGQPIPDSADVVATLRAPNAAASAAVSEVQSNPQPSSADAATMRFSFAPSAQLSADGVNVELVRARLQSLGDIVSVMPAVTPDGTIAFEFVVLMRPDRAPDPDWGKQGITWHEMAAQAPAVPPAAAPARPTTRSNLVRVDLARLDELILIVGELIMSRARLDDGVQQLRSEHSSRTINSIEETTELLERQMRDLRSAVMRVRLVQMGEVFERMRFVVRDVAAESGKQARVHTAGGTTEIDKAVVERIVEPLLHLVRNAVSHGLELPAERVRAGKNEVGEISLRAEAVGDMIVVQVADDGRGIDCERIRQLAVERGIIGPDVHLDIHNVLDILATPGFSTSASADLASGRGVGMDVVRATVRDLGGEMFVETAAGQGTCFTIHLPLTLMIVDALLVSVGGQTMAVPQPSLREVLRVDSADITPVENNEIMRYRDTVLPILRLAEVFGFSEDRAGGVSYVLVVGNETNRQGILVDRVLGLREIVVRSISDPLVDVPGIGGAAELSDGSVTLILDTAGLTRYAQERKIAKVL